MQQFMLKYVQNSLEMYGMGSEIERYRLDGRKKLDISESAENENKVLRTRCSIIEMFPHLGRVFKCYLEAPSSHI